MFVILCFLLQKFLVPTIRRRCSGSAGPPLPSLGSGLGGGNAAGVTAGAPRAGKYTKFVASRRAVSLYAAVVRSLDSGPPDASGHFFCLFISI